MATREREHGQRESRALCTASELSFRQPEGRFKLFQSLCTHEKLLQIIILIDVEKQSYRLSTKK